MPPLSEELRAIADTAFGALNAGDLDSFLSVVSEDAEFTSMIAEVEGQTYRGHEGVRAWWNTVAGTFQSVRWELLEVEGSGGRGLARLRAVGEVGRGRGRADGVAGRQVPRRQARLVGVLPCGVRCARGGGNRSRASVGGVPIA